jgi:hypothetical protein
MLVMGDHFLSRSILARDPFPFPIVGLSNALCSHYPFAGASRTAPEFGI